MRGHTALAVVVTVVALAATAWAGAPTDQVRQYTDQVQKILDDPTIRQADKRAAVRKVAVEIFDVTETAKRALGPHWNARTPAEREEFTQLFADLLERSYLSKIELYGGEKIQYVGDSVEGETATVKTRIATKSGSEVPIDYKMLRKGDRWLVYDVVIEGVSLISNYRTQFNKIIQSSSYPELVKKLKTRQGEFIQDEKSRKVSG